MRTVVIIQARMGSTRLPGKVLMDLGGKPMLARVVERCQESGFPVVVATTLQPEDDVICQWCETNSIDYYRGSVEPLERLACAAQRFEADIIVRVCADSPEFMPESIKCVAQGVMNGADYCAYRLANGKPAILTKLGLTCEALTYWCLSQENELMAEGDDIEHVTRGIYTKPRPWRIEWIPLDVGWLDLVDDPKTASRAIDTQADLDRERARLEVPA